MWCDEFTFLKISIIKYIKKKSSISYKITKMGTASILKRIDVLNRTQTIQGIYKAVKCIQSRPIEDANV